MEYVIIWFLIYFLPYIIAGSRNTKNSTQVLIINIFLGWTFIGWVIALAMSFSENIRTK